MGLAGQKAAVACRSQVSASFENARALVTLAPYATGRHKRRLDTQWKAEERGPPADFFRSRSCMTCLYRMFTEYHSTSGAHCTEISSRPHFAAEINGALKRRSARRERFALRSWSSRDLQLSCFCPSSRGVPQRLEFRRQPPR